MEYNLSESISWEALEHQDGNGSLLRIKNPKTFFAFGINYKTAPVEIRERLHLREEEIVEFLHILRQDVSECVVLSTCNRTEVYAVSEQTDIDRQYFTSKLTEFKNASDVVQDSHFFAMVSCAATQQLFNVATSIDSRVIGDSQILRQLRVAYELSQRNGFTGKVLNQLFQRAFKLGKTTYTETSIHDGAVSVSLAAVELAVDRFKSLRGRTALVVGAGEMSRCTAEALIHKGIGKILITNRTRARAEQLVEGLTQCGKVEFEVVDFDSFKERLDEVEIVISSTSADAPILYADDFDSNGPNKLVIDIAVPRDVDESVCEVPNVILRNVDDLRTIIDGHHERRINDLPKVKRLIVDEMVGFLTWYYSLPIMPEYERTGAKPTPERIAEVLKVKQFLNQNLSEIHRVAARSGGDFSEDLVNHFSLINRLCELKIQAFAVAA